MPPDGVFDLLVRFPTGQFARLTPEGTQYWYNHKGKLEKIIDKYKDNWHKFFGKKKNEKTD